MSARPKSIISTNLFLVMFATLGVVMNKFDADEKGEPFHISFSYPSESEKKDKDGNILAGDLLGERVATIARQMFPPPIEVEVFQRDDCWTEERGEYARKFLVSSILSKGLNFDSTIYM